MRRAAVTSWLDVAVVGGLCAAGAGFRAPGLTSRDLWFDDAWAALPAHVPLGDAVHMVVTTPIYTLAMRWWILASPSATWWAQLPAFAFGIAGVAAVYALVRVLGFSRLAAFFAGAVVVASPITVMYSARVKEYSADLLFACLVLWLFERWRRAPSPRALTMLCAASILALWTSASTAAVVGGAAAAAVLVAWSDRTVRRSVVSFVAALAVSSMLLWLVFLRHLPPQLRTNWRTHGYLFGYSSLRHVAYAFQQTFSGIAHGLVGLPIPYTFQGYALRDVPMTLAVLTVLALVAVVAPPLVTAIRSRGSARGVTVAAAATVVLAMLGTIVGAVPLGDGRTDEALYPAVLVLVVGAGAVVARRVSLQGAARRAARLGIAGAIGVAAMWFGTTHLAEYPPTGLRTVIQQLRAPGVMRPGDLIVVDGYESFTWGDEHLGPWAVSFHQYRVPWPMGFHVASRDPSIVLSRDYLQPDGSFATLALRSHRLWFVGPNVGGYSTSAPRYLWLFPLHTPTFLRLKALGWRARGECCHASGTYAQLFVHS